MTHQIAPSTLRRDIEEAAVIEHRASLDLMICRKDPALPLGTRFLAGMLTRVRSGLIEFLRRERERREFAAFDDAQLRELNQIAKRAGIVRAGSFHLGFRRR